MSCRQALEVRSEDRTPHKWRISLREDVFDSFIAQGGTIVQKVFGDGSLFSPMLFGKFFDPSDAFPLWDFDSDSFLSGLRASGRSSMDWFTTDTEYLLKAELPESDSKKKNEEVQVYVDNGKVLEISGRWRQQESNGNDWRSCNWWEYGYVRRIELPDFANWRRMEGYIDTHSIVIRIPKTIISDSDHLLQSNDIHDQETKENLSD